MERGKCLHDHEECRTEDCGHVYCDKMTELGLAPIDRVRKGILQLLKDNPGVTLELNSPWDGYRSMVFRYQGPGKPSYTTEIDFDPEDELDE
jgi:hypothetical protein